MYVARTRTHTVTQVSPFIQEATKASESRVFLQTSQSGNNYFEIKHLSFLNAI